MSQRERLLAIVVACLVGAVVLNYAYGRYQRAQSLRETQIEAARGELVDANLAVRNGERAMRRMEAWQKRSLPLDREKALSMYKDWLQARAKDAGLEVDNIKPATRPTLSAGFTAIGYQLEATGSLANVVKMLHSFYSSPIMQQITRLRLQRPVGGTQLQVLLEAEALLLPGATATDKLPEGEFKRLKLASLDDYQKSLGERDLATVYTPPRPPREATAQAAAPPPPKFDDAEHARFSGSVSVGGSYQAWIHVRTTGETLHLGPGDSFKVGELEGQIISVEPRSLVFQSGDKKFRVSMDQTLRKGTEIEAGGNGDKGHDTEQPGSRS